MMTGEFSRLSNWDYLNRYCFSDSGDQIGNFTYMFELPQIGAYKLNTFNDTGTFWKDAYGSVTNCEQKNLLAYTSESLTNMTYKTVTFSGEQVGHFWYFSISNCPFTEIFLDQVEIHLFNPSLGPSSQEFSCEQQGLLGLYTFYSLAFLIMAAGWGVALKTLYDENRLHTCARLFTMAFIFRLIGVLMIYAHLSTFANDGFGLIGLLVFGRILTFGSVAIFMLMLVLMSMGFSISKERINYQNPIVFTLSLFIIAYILLLMASQAVMDYGSNMSIFEQIPAIIILIIRMGVAGVFILAIMKTISTESDQRKREFYIKVAYIYSAWFLLYPVILLIGSVVPDVAKERTIDVLFETTEFLVCAGSIYLFWPASTLHIFLLDSDFVQETTSLRPGSEWSNLNQEKISSSDISSDV